MKIKYVTIVVSAILGLFAGMVFYPPQPMLTPFMMEFQGEYYHYLRLHTFVVIGFFVSIFAFSSCLYFKSTKFFTVVLMLLVGLIVTSLDYFRQSGALFLNIDYILAFVLGGLAGVGVVELAFKLIKAVKNQQQT